MCGVFCCLFAGVSAGVSQIDHGPTADLAAFWLRVAVFLLFWSGYAQYAWYVYCKYALFPIWLKETAQPNFPAETCWSQAEAVRPRFPARHENTPAKTHLIANLATALILNECLINANLISESNLIYPCCCLVYFTSTWFNWLLALSLPFLHPFIHSSFFFLSFVYWFKYMNLYHSYLHSNIE